MCVCVCVCIERDRESERERARAKERKMKKENLINNQHHSSSDIESGAPEIKFVFSIIKKKKKKNLYRIESSAPEMMRRARRG